MLFYIFKNNVEGVKAESETAYFLTLTENLDLNPDLGPTLSFHHASSF